MPRAPVMADFADEGFSTWLAAVSASRLVQLPVGKAARRESVLLAGEISQAVFRQLWQVRGRLPRGFLA
eukprot:10349335-Alexandrium_andersonii.AAC.1